MLIRRAVLGLLTASLLIPSTAAAIPNTGGGGGTGPDPNGELPIASFTAPSSALVYQTVSFNASGSYDPDGTIVRYEWDWDGNGSYDKTSTSAYASHAFGAYLNYTVRLRVTDNRGNKSTTSRVVIAHPPPKARFFVSPTQPTAGKAAYLVAKDSYASGGAPSFEWDLDGNGTYEANTDGHKPEHRVTFTTAGVHTVGLRVTDRYGVTDTTTLAITVKRGHVFDGAQTTSSGVLSAR
jgi:PKD repeat protein